MLTAEAPLDIRTSWRGDAAVIAVTGDLDVTNHHVLREAVLTAADLGATRIVVDLADLGFLDASGLGVLIGIRRQAAELGASLVVWRPAERVHKVLEATGLAEYLTEP